MKMNNRLIMGMAILVSAFVLSFGSASAKAQAPPPPPTHTNQYFTVSATPRLTYILAFGQVQNFTVTIVNTVSGSQPVTVNLSNVFGGANSMDGVNLDETMDHFVSVGYLAPVTVSYGQPQRVQLYLTDTFTDPNSTGATGYVQVYGAAIVNGAPVAATANILVRDSN